MMNSSNNNSPLVSIVVITYNSSKYVVETLESVKAQTYRNIELIVSDDCSTDNTVEVCRNWIEENKERFVRTELLTPNKNTGVSANCNRGVKAARGEWVKIIAGDDLLLDGCVEVNISNLVDGEYFYFSDLKILSNSTLREERIRKIVATRNYYFEGDQFYNFLKYEIGLSSPTWFLNRGELVKNGCFDETYKHFEDGPLAFKLLQRGYTFHYIRMETVVYRIHGDSVAYNKGVIVNPLFSESIRHFMIKEQIPELKKRKMYLEVWHEYLRLLYMWMAVTLCNKRSLLTIPFKFVFLLSPIFYMRRFVYTKNQ